MTTELTLAHFSQLYEQLSESYAALETELQLLREDRGYLSLGSKQEQFSKNGINEASELSRLFYLKNPLINRGVEVKKFYVFGRPPVISSPWPELNTIVQNFLSDHKNQLELTSHNAMQQREIERQTDGNIFLVLIPDEITGVVKLRSIDLAEITEIITNPDDRRDIWYYKREWTAGGKRYVALYPHFRLPNPPQSYDGLPVEQSSYIYHVKTGAFSSWQWGISEVYSALDWSKAYKSFLEDWATITRSLATFAFKIKTTGGARGVAAIKGTLNTTLSAQDRETNPPPARGSTAIMTADRDIEPIKTAGATTSMEDGRRLLLMVAAATGLPETFFGDASVGSLATSKSLDRPTELMMLSIQSLWISVFQDILNFCAFWSVKAPQGDLKNFGTVQDNVVLWENDPETGEPYKGEIQVHFPPVVEGDVQAHVAALASAAAYIPDEKLLARLFLSHLGVDDASELVDQMFADQQTISRQAAEAAKDMRESIKRVVEAWKNEGT